MIRIRLPRTTARFVATGATAALLLSGASALHAQASCATEKKMLDEVVSKIHNTPTHVYSTAKMGNQNVDTEIIYAAGNLYMKINGKWSQAGTIKEMEDAAREKQKKATPNDVCGPAKDEMLNGQMTTVYSSHSESSRGTTLDMRFWISKSSGLMLRQQISSDGGKSVIDSRYEYGNVKPPL